MAIALDAMGGDLAPAATVEGALRAHRERGLEVILVGDDARLRVELRRLGAEAGGSLPTLGGAGRAVLVDMGANVDVTPLQLVQFALLGEVYARRILAVARLSVGVVANGEEEEKGTDLTRAAAAALRKPGSGVHFKGYVEARDVLSGEVDVVATDGFTGNVLLKTAEGAVWAFGQLLKRQIQGSPVASAGALLLGSALEQVKKRVDYEEVGGAPLLGVRGTGLVAHGRSSPRAILNALSAAEDFAARGIEGELQEAAQRATGLFEKNAA
jgi:glycerol-3-phosphate acyltransferase PlsX